MNSPLFNVQRATLPLPDKLIIVAGQYIFLSFEWSDDDGNPLDLEGHIFKIELFQGGVELLEHAEAALPSGSNVSSILVPQSTSESLVSGEIVGVVNITVSVTDPESFTTLLFSDVAIVEQHG